MKWLARFSPLALSALTACQSHERVRDERFEIAFHVTTDDGGALAGVRLAAQQQVLGSTDSEGRLQAAVTGREGQSLSVRITCPDGYVAPSEPPALRLARTRQVGGAAPQPMAFDAVCTREARDIVVVVHAERGAGLPVHVDGEQIGTTDARGNAHIALSVDRSARTLNASLDTTGHPELKPKNPNRVFELHGRDAILVFDQTFQMQKARRPARRASAAPKRHIPYRVD